MTQIRFHQTLRDKLVIEIADEMERIAGGYTDYNVYREQVGLIKGLKRALQVAEEIEKGMT